MSLTHELIEELLRTHGAEVRRQLGPGEYHLEVSRRGSPPGIEVIVTGDIDRVLPGAITVEHNSDRVTVPVCVDVQFTRCDGGEGGGGI